MKLLKKSPLDITATFLIPQTTRNDYFLSTCLHCIKGMIHNRLQETFISKFSNWRLLSTQPRQLLHMKFGHSAKLLKYPKKGLKNELARREVETANNQAQLTDHYPQKQQKDTTLEITQGQDWMLPIKENAAGHPAHDKLQPNRYSSKNILAGQSILCVGGRAALYPEYHRLIASLGARLLIYRGSMENNMNHLYALLENADMVICPIDCVNHNDFFAVKFYCKFSGKPYTLLDRSNLITFNKGVKTLTRLACKHACFPNGHNQAASIQQN